MNTSKLICDKCKREIKLKPKHTKIVKVEGEIERMYFKCSHCNTKYTISYTDGEFRNNIEKIKFVLVKLQDKTLSEAEVRELVNQHDELVKLNKEISQNYRKKYEA